MLHRLALLCLACALVSLKGENEDATVFLQSSAKPTADLDITQYQTYRSAGRASRHENRRISPARMVMLENQKQVYAQHDLQAAQQGNEEYQKSTHGRMMVDAQNGGKGRAQHPTGMKHRNGNGEGIGGEDGMQIGENNQDIADMDPTVPLEKQGGFQADQAQDQAPPQMQMQQQPQMQQRQPQPQMERQSQPQMEKQSMPQPLRTAGAALHQNPDYIEATAASPGGGVDHPLPPQQQAAIEAMEQRQKNTHMSGSRPQPMDGPGPIADSSIKRMMGGSRPLPGPGMNRMSLSAVQNSMGGMGGMMGGNNMGGMMGGNSMGGMMGGNSMGGMRGNSMSMGMGGNGMGGLMGGNGMSMGSMMGGNNMGGNGMGGMMGGNNMGGMMGGNNMGGMMGGNNMGGMMGGNNMGGLMGGNSMGGMMGGNSMGGMMGGNSMSMGMGGNNMGGMMGGNNMGGMMGGNSMGGMMGGNSMGGMRGNGMGANIQSMMGNPSLRGFNSGSMSMGDMMGSAGLNNLNQNNNANTMMFGNQSPLTSKAMKTQVPNMSDMEEDEKLLPMPKRLPPKRAASKPSSKQSSKGGVRKVKPSEKKKLPKFHEVTKDDIGSFGW